MRHSRFLAAAFLVLASALPAAPALAGDPAADKVLDCMRANIPKTLRIQDFDITATDRVKGKRVLKGRLYAKNEDGLVRATVKIKAPPDLANAAYLMREGKERDDMYVFLPALNRTKRIVGGSADGPLFGTDLSYADIKQVQNAFSGGAVKLEAGAEAIEGRQTQLLSMVPRADSQSRYSLVKSWVDAQSCVTLKTEFYTGATAAKRMTVSPKALKQNSTHWYAEELLMQDLKQGSQTTLKITGVTSDSKLSDSLFNSNSFHIGS